MLKLMKAQKQKDPNTLTREYNNIKYKYTNTINISAIFI